jgi:hypothetical protein
MQTPAILADFSGFKNNYDCKNTADETGWRGLGTFTLA